MGARIVLEQYDRSMPNPRVEGVENEEIGYGFECHLSTAHGGPETGDLRRSHGRSACVTATIRPDSDREAECAPCSLSDEHCRGQRRWGKLVKRCRRCRGRRRRRAARMRRVRYCCDCCVTCERDCCMDRGRWVPLLFVCERGELRRRIPELPHLRIPPPRRKVASGAYNSSSLSPSTSCSLSPRCLAVVPPPSPTHRPPRWHEMPS